MLNAMAQGSRCFVGTSLALFCRTAKVTKLYGLYTILKPGFHNTHALAFQDLNNH